MKSLLVVIIAAMCSILSANTLLAQTKLKITATFSDTVWTGVDYTPAVFSVDDKIIIIGHGTTHEIAQVRAKLMQDCLIDMGFDESMFEISTIISDSNVATATQFSNSYIPGNWDYPVKKQ